MRGPDHAWMLAVRKWSREEERMSKASEWARMAPAMVFRETEVDEGMDPFVAVVSSEGDLVFDECENSEDAMRLSPAMAMRFARWILDTFGEGS